MATPQALLTFDLTDLEKRLSGLNSFGLSDLLSKSTCSSEFYYTK